MDLDRAIVRLPVRSVRTRIARTIVGVTALIVVALGVPLAIVIQRFYESRATVELQRSAAEAIAELTVPLDPAEISDAASESDSPPDFSVYDETGVKIFGTGPRELEDADPDQLVVISAITDRATETVVGSVRVSRPRSDVAGEARRAWAVMGLAALGALAAAMIIARREAARLAAPIADLAARAERIGSGELFLATRPTGTPELDTLARALALSARRLDELIAREREFSANASHQLRTPLAGLRVSLERGDLAAASAEAERLSATVDHMLALARDALPTPAEVDVGPCLESADLRWREVFRDAGRALTATIGPSLPRVRVRPASLDQILDVLIDNSLRHGAGETRILARPTAGGLVVQIDDDGPGIAPGSVASVFDRHEGSSTGIGLALARTLVEADGGKLMLSDPDRAEFRIIFAASPPRRIPLHEE
jgi:signal transduction histidine kinase